MTNVSADFVIDVGVLVILPFTAEGNPMGDEVEGI